MYLLFLYVKPALVNLFCYMTQKLTLNLVEQHNISRRDKAIKNVLKLLTIKRTVNNRITLMPLAPELSQVSQETWCLGTKRGSVFLCVDGFPAFIDSLHLSSPASSANPGTPLLRLRLSSTTSRQHLPEKDSKWLVVDNVSC